MSSHGEPAVAQGPLILSYARRHMHADVNSHTRVQIHTHTYDCAHAYTEAGLPTDTRSHVFKCAHTHTHMHTHRSRHNHTHTHTHSHINTCTNMWTHTHTHTHTHTCLHAHVQEFRHALLRKTGCRMDIPTNGETDRRSDGWIDG